MQDLKKTEDYKIKFVCQMQDNCYQENLYIDNILQDSEFDSPTVRRAEQFFHAFSPETITRQMSNAYGENFVLVFRTTAQQMQSFCEINFHEIFTKNA